MTVIATAPGTIETPPAEALERHPLMGALPDDDALTTHLLKPIWTPNHTWRWLFLVTGALAVLFLVAIAITVSRGIGTWGNNIPVA